MCIWLGLHYLTTKIFSTIFPASRNFNVYFQEEENVESKHIVEILSANFSPRNVGVNLYQKISKIPYKKNNYYKLLVCNIEFISKFTQTFQVFWSIWNISKNPLLINITKVGLNGALFMQALPLNVLLLLNNFQNCIPWQNTNRFVPSIKLWTYI